MDAVPLKDMELAVDKVNEVHRKLARVAVTAEALYKLDIARCVISGDHREQLNVFAKVPLTDSSASSSASKARWQAYDVTPLSFLYREQVSDPKQPNPLRQTFQKIKHMAETCVVLGRAVLGPIPDHY